MIQPRPTDPITISFTRAQLELALRHLPTAHFRPLSEAAALDELRREFADALEAISS